MLFLPVLLVAQAGPQVPLDNPYVHVVDAVDAPHSRSPQHRHTVNRVMVYLTRCDTRLTSPDGKVEQQRWKPGDVAWSPAGGLHTSENPNDTACKIVEIELKPGAGRQAVAAGVLDPVRVDPRHYRVLIDNEHVRVLRAAYGAHETGAEHRHDRDRVTVFLADSELRVTGTDGRSQTLRTSRGQVGWGGVAQHREYNAGDSPFEVIAVELKAR